jgi:hypothetical protein
MIMRVKFVINIFEITVIISVVFSLPCVHCFIYHINNNTFMYIITLFYYMYIVITVLHEIFHIGLYFLSYLKASLCNNEWNLF